MNCRLCNGPLFEKPNLILPGMPSGAQAFLDRPDNKTSLVDLHVCQCRQCGLIQLDNEPVSYWRSVITAAAWSPEMTAFRRQQAADFVQRFDLSGRHILEVGCGEGYFLELLAAAGAIPTGLEYGTVSLQRGLAAGRPIEQGYITEMPVGEEIYDAFVCINFLEHSPNPGHFIDAISARLKPEAFGLVEVPSLDTTIARRRYYDFVQDHLSYFTRDTLCLAFESHGFRILECGPVWHDEDVAIIVQRRTQGAFAEWLDNDYLIQDFRSLTEQSKYRNIAMWGASHQAMSLIAMAKPRKVKFIVDSAPTKQGRFEPVLGLAILPPEELMKRGADLVVVMAAGYSDEVLSILTQTMEFPNDIAVLRNGRLEIVQLSAVNMVDQIS